jgi:6,7-dimethyl-8-ribityllumazine synthase
VQTFIGRARSGGQKIGIVVSRFNDLITERLLAGARACLLDHGADEAAV